MSYTQYINDLLQNSSKEELINMYELFEQSKSEAWQKYYEIKIKHDKTQIIFEEVTIKLEKALDKACYNYILEKLNYKVGKETCYKLAQEEKQKLLKESEKQNV